MASLLCTLWSFLALSCLLAPGSHARVLLQGPSPPLSPHGPIRPDGEQFPLATSQSKQTLRDLVNALDVMQDSYFELWQGTWPTGNDWTRAVHGTHVSATLSSLTGATDDALLATMLGDNPGDREELVTQHSVALENLVSHFFTHVQAFYFGEHDFALRNQAFDDMLWVVLDWLESIKFGVLHSDLHYGGATSRTGGRPWHGTQLRTPAAHRVRVFYELASQGWDTFLCGGGMIWSPYLGPYKNAITNELYISASIAMYLYYPGDRIDAPFVAGEGESADGLQHDPLYLSTAEKAYRWLKNSNMTGIFNLYGDGFHIRGYQNRQNPGTRKCDVLNTMVYTYNQGVILSGLKGLWLATGSEEYLHDGHELLQNVMRATGWPNIYDQRWKGLGRAGILEDACDSHGDCSQDGQNFKGIFFHHFTEFCRPLRPQELRFLRTQPWAKARGWERSFEWHQAWCSTYRPWIERNAEAALVTRNEEGKFGMWWGRRYRVFDESTTHDSPLPDGATDYRNHPDSIPPYWDKNDTAMAHELGATNALNDQPEYNDRGRGRTVETQAGGVAVLRALYQWKTAPSLSGDFI
ncbi:putative glycosyl hydrolase [Aspergillus lucknowensis]|uniref:Glycosyl hydrolase n=1 Tax=Aspergillus lucknowensis TaxID=176173 RepID=A0ABR4LXC3_9EURO